MDGENRCVVTGIGVFSHLGKSKDNFWEALVQEGRSFKNFFIDNECRNEGEDPVFDYSFAAVEDAIADSGIGIDLSDIARRKVGVIFGSSRGPFSSTCNVVRKLQSGTEVGIKDLVHSHYGTLATSAARKHGFGGPCQVVSTTCTSSANALGNAYFQIRNGSCDVVIAGGVEKSSVPELQKLFESAGILSQRGVSKPFDEDRDGTVLSDGAAVLVLESLRNATGRGAKIYAEVMGYGASMDLYDQNNPIRARSQIGEGIARAMEDALGFSRLKPSDISAVFCHAPGTKVGDLNECYGLGRIFPSDKPHVTSIKGSIGHHVGASAAFQAVAAVMSLSRGIVPYIHNFSSASSRMNSLNYVARESRDVGLNIVLSNTLGIDGTNASLVFRKFEG